MVVSSPARSPVAASALPPVPPSSSSPASRLSSTSDEPGASRHSPRYRGCSRSLGGSSNMSTTAAGASSAAASGVPRMSRKRAAPTEATDRLAASARSTCGATATRYQGGITAERLVSLVLRTARKSSSPSWAHPKIAAEPAAQSIQRIAAAHRGVNRHHRDRDVGREIVPCGLQPSVLRARWQPLTRLANQLFHCRPGGPKRNIESQKVVLSCARQQQHVDRRLLRTVRCVRGLAHHASPGAAAPPPH